MTPRKAVKYKDICALSTDNTATSEGWIIIDGGVVTLRNQRPGESSTGSVTFSRRAFNALIDWYARPQGVRKVKGFKTKK